MGHEVSEVGEGPSRELDHVVMGDRPWFEVDDEARLEGSIEDEEVVTGVALQVVAARAGK